MKADLKTVIFERRGPIAVVTLNRPQARNAYDDTMQGELSEVWREVRGNPEIWVAVLTGARSEEHTSELQSLLRISYAVFCLKTKNQVVIIHSRDNQYDITTPL